MKQKLLYLLLFVACFAQAQQATIREIRIEGLKKTKASFLKQFIKSQPGQAFSPTAIEGDLQNLVSLGMVADASYRLDTTKQGIVLRYDIEEAFTLFPIVNFGRVGRNFWYQLGISEFNLFGRGAELTAVYRNNEGRDNVQFSYKMPYLADAKWGFSAQFLKWASIEPLYFGDNQVFYNYDNTSYGGTLIHHFSLRNHIELGGAYFTETYQKNERHSNEITPGPEAATRHKSLVKLLHKYERLKYHYYYRSGFDNLLNLQAVYDFSEGQPFYILINDTRFFKRTSPMGNFAARLRIGLSSNEDSPFAPFVLDSNVNIRGSGNRIDRGTAALILNLEYRHTVFDRHQVAAQVVGFSDTGTWRNPGGQLNDLVDGANFRHFIGGGLRLIYKNAFNAIFRIDYGIDLYNFEERGLVLGLGQYF